MNSITFNGIRKPYVSVLSRDIPYWFPRTPEIVTNKNRHRIKRITIEPMPIPLTLAIDGDSREDLANKAEEVADWLITTKEAPLVFDHKPNRAFYTVLNGAVDVDEIVMFGTASLEFVALYKTGKSKQIPATTSEKQHQITGQTETPWTVEVSFKANTNKFELWAGDIYLLLNYSFIAGDKLVVNYVGREVFLNGNDLRKAVSMSSHFKELKPGTVEIKASVPCTIKYDERYY